MTSQKRSSKHDGSRPKRVMQRKQVKSGYVRLEFEQRIIEKNPALFDFYLKTLREIAASGQKTPLITQQMAIEFTKKFAEENKIPWEI